MQLNSKKTIWIIRPGALGDSILLTPLIKKLLKDGFDVTVTGTFPHLSFLKCLFPNVVFNRFDDVQMTKLFLSEFDENVCLDFIKTKPYGILNFLNFDLKIDEQLSSLCIKYVNKPLIESGDDSIAQQMYHSFYEDEGFEFLPEVSKDYNEDVLFHFGTGSPKKLLNATSVEFLIDLIDQEFNGSKSILIGPSDQINFNLKSHINVIQCDRADYLHKCLLKARYYFGIDSGVSHAAGVLGNRGLAFFTYSDLAYWSPLGFVKSIQFSKFYELDDKVPVLRQD